jgi:hypothetical protein
VEQAQERVQYIGINSVESLSFATKEFFYLVTRELD